jgi:hypothetical protein
VQSGRGEGEWVGCACLVRRPRFLRGEQPSLPGSYRDLAPVNVFADSDRWWKTSVFHHVLKGARGHAQALTERLFVELFDDAGVV